MSFKSTLNNSASTALFVFIWSSGAIFAEWGLQHASALMFLILRFAIALTVLTVVGIYRRRWLPRSGTRLRIATTGLLLTGGYSVCYFLATGLGEIMYYTLGYERDAKKKPATEREQLMELYETQQFVVRPALRGVPGVADINTNGGYMKQVVVQPLPEQLAGRGRIHQRGQTAYRCGS